MGRRPRSSMDRAPDFGSGGCEFDSCRGYHHAKFARLEHSLEHVIEPLCLAADVGGEHAHFFVVRSLHRRVKSTGCSRAAGGTGRRARLRGVWGNPSGFESRVAHHTLVLQSAESGSFPRGNHALTERPWFFPRGNRELSLQARLRSGPRSSRRPLAAYGESVLRGKSGCEAHGQIAARDPARRAHDGIANGNTAAAAARHGPLARPQAQVSLHDEEGAFLGRPDLYHPEHRLGLEYDGSVHRETLVADNRRQNRLLNRLPAAEIHRRRHLSDARCRG